MWLESYIADISHMYGLSEEEVKQIMCSTLEGYYSEKYQCPVLCSFVPDSSLSLHKYLENGKERDIVLQRYDVTALSHILNKEYENSSLSKKENYLKPLVNQLVTGAVSDISDDEICMAVLIGLNYMVTGILGKMHIPPHMRNHFELGQEFRCLIIGIKRMQSDIALVLSLTSRKLVEAFFEEKGYDVNCGRRIAGAKSYLKTDHKIPESVIKSVSGALKEQMIVQVLF